MSLHQAIDLPTRPVPLIERRRLDDLFDAVAESRVTIVTAPAGFGKSATIGRWCDRFIADGRVVLWLGGRDIAAADFGAALRQASAMAGLVWDDADALPGWLRDGHRPVLIIDDAERLSPIAQQALEALIVAGRDSLTTVLASRGRSVVPVARLRAMGRLVEVGASDLRLSTLESAELIASRAEAPIDTAWSDFIYRTMMGWPAGTALAAELAVPRGQPESYGNDRAVLHLTRNLRAYFAEEVLDRQPATLRRVLVELSILPVVGREVAQAVTGRSDVGKLLEEAADRGLFVCRAERERTGYHFHPLFRETLRDVLHEEDAHHAAELHRRAAEHWVTHDEPNRALSHAEASGDAAFLASVLERLAEPLTYRGELEQVVAIASRIDWPTLARSPAILLCIAWRQIRALAFADAERSLDAAASAIDLQRAGRDVDERRIAEMDRLLRHRRALLLAARDDMPETERVSSELLAEVGDDNAYISCTLLAQLMAARRELFHLSDALSLEAATRRVLGRPGSRFASIALKAAVAPTLALQGKTAAAQAMLEDALALAESYSEAGSALAALPALPLAELSYELGDIDRARALIDRHLPVAREWLYTDQLCAGHLVRARILAAEGDRSAALAALDEAQLVALECGLGRMRSLAATAQVQLLLLEGRVEAAERVARTAGVDPAKEPIPTLQPTRCQEAAAIAWIRLKMRQMQLGTAERIARRWRDLVKRAEAVRSIVQFDLLLAEIAMLDGDDGEARRHIRAAVVGAAEPGWIQLFLDGGSAVAGLLRAAYGDGQSVDTAADRFAGSLLARVGAAPAEISGGGLSDRLAGREVEILTLVGGGLRNREIGQRLGLTEGTVKWYMQQVYDKLGVRRRPHAVSRARSLGLIA